jgi:hypothetical protein
MKVSIPQAPIAAYDRSHAIDHARIHELWEEATNPGGRLLVRPHGDYPEHHAVLWVPTRPELLPLDLDDYSIEEAGVQTARYALPGYAEVRLRFEAILTELHAVGIVPYLELDCSDSADVGADRLTIEVDDSGHGAPDVSINYETNVMPHDVEPGEASPASVNHDVSAWTPAAFVEFVKAAHGIALE